MWKLKQNTEIRRYWYEPTRPLNVDHEEGNIKLIKKQQQQRLEQPANLIIRIISDASTRTIVMKIKSTRAIRLFSHQINGF